SLASQQCCRYCVSADRRSVTVTFFFKRNPKLSQSANDSVSEAQADARPLLAGLDVYLCKGPAIAGRPDVFGRLCFGPGHYWPGWTRVLTHLDYWGHGWGGSWPARR